MTPEANECPSTIHGNRERGTGIVNNELYVGRLVWNRLRYVKDPETGRRNSRLNPRDAWIVQEVPELRIIEQPLWDRVAPARKACCSSRTTRWCATTLSPSLSASANK